MESVSRITDLVNDRVGKSTFGRVFRLSGCGHEKEIKNSRFLTEIRAGLTTFFTMSYIIAVNASILSDTGGTCECTSKTDPLCLTDNAYAQCSLEVRHDLITATAAISGLASIMFGFLTNLPVALAPGMGLNAYFAYEVVGFHASKSVPYQLALTAVFIEGFVFVLLALTGMRQWLVSILPNSLKVAAGCGIGLFLSIIGLGGAGIGLISSGGPATPVTLAGCPAEYVDATTGMCTSHKMQSPTLWIGVFCGGFLTTYLMSYKFKSAIIIGIAVVSIISWPRNTSFTYFPHTEEGDARFDFFQKVASLHPIQRTLNVIDWDISKAGAQFALALFTFLYVDIIDATATLFSMARYSGVVDPETQSFPRATLAYCTDAVAISIGALFGSSPVTAFIESGAGIAEGGRTGLTAMTTGVCFLLSLFFAPILASIPPWATGCTLVIVGCMMMRQATAINWRYIGDALPAFVTLVVTPFSYSIAYGLIAGLLTYVVLNGLTWLTSLITCGYITPVDEDYREYWTIKPGGALPWFIRAVQDPHGVFSRPQVQETESIKSPSKGSSHGSFDSTGMKVLKGDVSIVIGDSAEPSEGRNWHEGSSSS